MGGKTRKEIVLQKCPLFSVKIFNCNYSIFFTTLHKKPYEKFLDMKNQLIWPIEDFKVCYNYYHFDMVHEALKKVLLTVI